MPFDGPEKRLALHRRNARYRALAGYGVPVRATWFFDDDPDWDVTFYNFWITCTACGHSTGETGHFLLETERRMLEDLYRCGCTHLDALTLPDWLLPEEVRALWELEIVSGT